MKRELYPDDWEAISLRIRERAGWRCEWCGVEYGQPNPITGSTVVLSVAHLDHDPSNCADDNLRALCQRCHLNYDHDEHIFNAGITRRRKRAAAGQMEMNL